MACCNGILDLEVQSYCDKIVLPLVADVDGIYTIMRQNRSMTIIRHLFTNGNTIEFDNVYSESDIIVFQVKKPDGTIMTDADGNDCFRIKIIPYKDVYIS
jgi:hypothetical protein